MTLPAKAILITSARRSKEWPGWNRKRAEASPKRAGPHTKKTTKCQLYLLPPASNSRQAKAGRNKENYVILSTCKKGSKKQIKIVTQQHRLSTKQHRATESSHMIQKHNPHKAPQSPGGEIGRRKGLKIPRGKPRAGSSPAPGTK